MTKRNVVAIKPQDVDPRPFCVKRIANNDDELIKAINQLDAEGYEVVDWCWGDHAHSSSNWLIVAFRMPKDQQHLTPSID